MANIVAELRRPTLILAHNKTLAAQLYGEMREFFPKNSVEYFVSYYDYYQPEAYVPSSDTYIEKDASINNHIEQMRLSATKALLERSDTIIVATVSAIYGLGDPKAYLGMVLHLVRGETIDQREILRRLAETSIHPESAGSAQGTTASGETSSISFPPSRNAKPCAWSYSMTKSKSSVIFDPLTGEVSRRVPRATIYPKTTTSRRGTSAGSRRSDSKGSWHPTEGTARRKQARGSAAPRADAHALISK